MPESAHLSSYELEIYLFRARLSFHSDTRIHYLYFGGCKGFRGDTRSTKQGSRVVRVLGGRVYTGTEEEVSSTELWVSQSTQNGFRYSGRSPSRPLSWS